MYNVIFSSGSYIMVFKIKVSKDKFMRAFFRDNTVSGLVKLLNVSRPTVYGYLLKYGLQADAAVGATRKFTDKEFREATKVTDNRHELAKMFGCSTANIIKHAKRLEIKLWAPETLSQQSGKIYDMYYGHNTITDIARHYECSPQVIRRYIEKEMSSKDFGEYPIPRTASEVKIVKMLLKDEELFSDAPLLAEATKLPLSKVNKYLQYYYNEMPWKRKRKRKGRRAKR